jgi:hypothetical protein
VGSLDDDVDDESKLEKKMVVVVTGGGDDTSKVVVVAEGGSVMVVGGGRAERRKQSEYMRTVKGEKGQTRDGCGDGGKKDGEASEEWVRIVGITDERGGERTLSGDDEAGRDEGKEGNPRGHWERGGRRRDGRSMGERHLSEEKAAAKDDKYRTWPCKCQCHSDRWNLTEGILIAHDVFPPVSPLGS